VPSRRLLVAPYYYPPFPGSGNRWPTIAKYLRNEGHEVTILATDAYGRLDDDEEERHIIRVPDIRSSPKLRRLLRRGPLSQAGVDGDEGEQTALLTKVLVPDINAVTWLPAALRAARRAIDDVDCLITSSPPESVHLLGLLLGRRRPAWVAEFRDGWTFEPLRAPFPTEPQRRLNGWLERRVVTSADITVGVTKPIADDLSARFGVEARYVPNGWDPEQLPFDVAPSTIAQADEGEVRVVYTGSLGQRRDLEPFLKALMLVRDEGLPVRLLLAGRLSTSEQNRLLQADVVAGVHFEGTMSRPLALQLQRSADALLLVTSHNKSEATAKVFEYLGAGRPIIALAGENEAARIVRSAAAGIVVALDDVDAIADALRAAAAGSIRPPDTAASEPYRYPAPALATAETVEEAIARSSSGR
jgi:glycosyltransferase involved in cell wall biosynthesis